MTRKVAQSAKSLENKMNRTYKYYYDILSFLRPIVLGSYLIALIISGCSEESRTLLTRSRSPDGIWMASAESVNGGAFGGSYDITNIYLNQSENFDQKVNIVSFSHEYNTMRIKLIWLDSRHLRVDYGGFINKRDEISVNFVAVKLADVNISIMRTPD